MIIIVHDVVHTVCCAQRSQKKKTKAPDDCTVPRRVRDLWITFISRRYNRIAAVTRRRYANCSGLIPPGSMTRDPLWHTCRFIDDRIQSFVAYSRGVVAAVLTHANSQTHVYKHGCDNKTCITLVLSTPNDICGRIAVVYYSRRNTNDQHAW